MHLRHVEFSDANVVCRQEKKTMNGARRLSVLSGVIVIPRANDLSADATRSIQAW